VSTGKNTSKEGAASGRLRRNARLGRKGASCEITALSVSSPSRSVGVGNLPKTPFSRNWALAEKGHSSKQPTTLQSAEKRVYWDSGGKRKLTAGPKRSVQYLDWCWPPCWTVSFTSGWFIKLFFMFSASVRLIATKASSK